MTFTRVNGLYNFGASESGCIVIQESWSIDLNETVQGNTAEQHTITVEQPNHPVLEHTQNLKSAMILLCWALVQRLSRHIDDALLWGVYKLLHFIVYVTVGGSV